MLCTKVDTVGIAKLCQQSTVRSNAPQQTMVLSYSALARGIREPLASGGGKIFNSPEFLRHFEEKRIGESRRTMVLFQKIARKYRQVFPEFFQSCPNLPPLRTPVALTQKLWQNTSYLQRSGLNNWFYMVIIILLHTWIFAVQNW